MTRRKRVRMWWALGCEVSHHECYDWRLSSLLYHKAPRNIGGYVLEASDLRVESRERCTSVQASAAPNSVIGNVHRLGCCGRLHSPSGQARGVACHIEHAFQVAKPAASAEGFLSAAPAAIPNPFVHEFFQAAVPSPSHSPSTHNPPPHP